VIPDGIYIGLPMAAYLGDPALGSGDLKDCLLQPVQWHGRKRNPTWRDHLAPKGKDAEVSTIHTAFGEALHCAVLEPEEFDDRYLVEPQRPDWPKTKEQIANAIRASGNGHFVPRDTMPHSHFVAAARAANVKIAEDWENELALMAAGRIRISGKWKFELLTLQRVIERHSSAAKWVTGGLSEVSVFFTDDHGHRYKCRFDHLRIRTMCDIKSYTIKAGMTPVESFISTVGAFGYDFSAAVYSEIRREVVPALVKAGAIFDVLGAEEIDGEWVVNFEEAEAERVEFFRRMADYEDPQWAWLAVAKFAVPEVDIVRFPNDLLAMKSAQYQVAMAKDNYRRMREKFGDDDDQMWVDDRGSISLTDYNFSQRTTDRGAVKYETE
jgi:hypothetical protein